MTGEEQNQPATGPPPWTFEDYEALKRRLGVALKPGQRIVTKLDFECPEKSAFQKVPEK
jgi:hypothetical protein